METQQTIGEWAEATFNQTVTGYAMHMLTEAIELCFASGVDVYSVNWTVKHAVDKCVLKASLDVAEECADVVILASGLANYIGVDLGEAVTEKMAINRKRTWGKTNAIGFTEHVD